MLGNGRHRRAIASTLCEIEGLLPLVEEGTLDECLYGVPVCASALPRLADLSKKIKIVLMIDCDQQIDLLEKHNQKTLSSSAWDVFIKVDVGTHRAGVTLSSKSLPTLVKRVGSSSASQLYGFYCHAGHSYSVHNAEEALAMLHLEVNGVTEAARLATPGSRKLVVSVGATPTAHVVSALKAIIPSTLELELHAGNFCANDLQQLATGLISESHLAIRIMAEVCSVYPERNEALINAGVIALTRETSDFAGHGKPVDHPAWNVVRVSQEHGILGRLHGAGGNVEEEFKVGDRVLLWCQHACITASNFHVYFVVDENDVVVDTWIPWKGW
jgi:D-serine deaminase-like pyridoxal phosphate-dependent protein